MKKSAVGRLHLIYGIVLSILLIAVGVCLIGSCIAIYNSGENPFSRESVAEQFEKIAGLVYLCIGAVVVGAILTWVFPVEKPRARATVEPEVTISRLLKRIDDADVSPQQREALRRGYRIRFCNRVLCTCVCVICAIPPMLYLFDAENFTLDNLNGDVFAAIRLVILCSVIAFGTCIAVRLFNDWSRRRQIEALKGILATATPRRKSKSEEIHESMMWTRRDAVKTLALVLPIVCLCICTFVLIFAGFSHSITPSVLGTLWILLAGVMTAVLLTGILLCALSRSPERNVQSATISRSWHITAVRIAVVLIAFLFIVLGILNGGMGDVLAKAVRICTECIGLG